MRKVIFPLAMFALTAGLLAGCGGASNTSGQAAQKLAIEMGPMSFNPAQIELQKGQPVALTITNKATVLHDWTIEKIEAEKMKEKSAGDHDMSNMKEPDLHLSVDVGKTGTLEFTPKESGTYTFYCTVPGHRDADMKGTLTVK